MRRPVMMPLAFALIAVAVAVSASGVGGASRFSSETAVKTALAPCTSGGVGTTEVNRKRDIALGPLMLLGVRLTTRHRRRDAFNGHGYKVPVTLPEGIAATLSVPRALRSRVGLVFTHRAQDRVWRSGVAGADSAVRFTACRTKKATGRTGWAGGLVVDHPRCATLVVKVADGQSVRRRVPLGRRCG